MRNAKAIIFASLVLTIFCIACSTSKNKNANAIKTYSPESKQLYDSIVRMDSLWEDAYNNCKMDQQDLLISDNLEFYHDQGGLLTSKKALMEAFKKNICGKVTRELLKGSIEVYPIHDYGAVEMGMHRFHSVNDTGIPHFAKFVHIWHKENGQWKITRVISLH